jgi:dynein intermediate chain 2
MHFQQQSEGAGDSCNSYVWDVNNPSTPDFELRSGSQLCCCSYNAKDSNVLLGGLYNGQVAYWDTRKGHSPCDSSPIERSHRDPVYDAAWLVSKTASECASVSTDGYVHWWDTRRMNEPVESLLLTERGQSSVLGAVCLEYCEAAKFLVGTEHGTALSCNRKAKTPAERIGASYVGHHGPVYSLRRHPFFPKYFMSVGDWTARVWMEDLRSPVMTTRYHAAGLSSGAWSPTRPGVFFTARMDGELDIWDYYYRQNDPALTVHVTDKALTSLNVHEGGRILMVGAADGATTLLELSENLSIAQPGEKQGMSQIFERETKRERNLEARMRELKQKQKREHARGSIAPAGADTVPGGDQDDGLSLLTEEFMAAVAVGSCH